MNSTLRNAMLSTAIAAATVFPAATAFGANATTPQTGAIISVDRETRTLTVRDNASNETFRVAIPKEAQVAITPVSSRGTAVNFEQVMVGMQYRGVR